MPISLPTYVNFLELLKQFATNLVNESHIKTYLLNILEAGIYSQGVDRSTLPPLKALGEIFSCLFQVLVEASIPWLVV